MSWLHKWFGRGTKEDPLLTLKLRLTRWRRLLKVEESCFHVLEDMREKLSGEYLFDRQYILSSADRIFQEAYQVAYDMGILCDQGEVEMYSWLDKMKDKATGSLNSWPMIGEGIPVVPLRGKEWVRPDRVGEMASYIMEILKEGWIDIPPGFVITIQGFLQVLVSNELDHYLQPDPALRESDWVERYQSLSQGLSKATIPEDLKRAISEALRNLGVNKESSRSFILWPSPIRSQAIPIFPFPTLAWSGESPETLWDILRSLWSRVYQNFRFEETLFPGRYPLATAVVCQRQISGGEGYGVQTVDPSHPDARGMVVRRLVPSPSLGPSELKPSPEFHISRTCHEGLGRRSDLENEGWSAEKRQRLIQLSLRIENHFKRAQEILWKEGPGGHPYPMQLRNQNIPHEAKAASAPLPALRQWPRYYDGQGSIVSRGIVMGPAVQLKPGQDLPLFPEGGILVAPDWNPVWEKFLHGISAILIEHAPSPFLTFLTRSLRIPMICQLPQATEKIPDGAVITVDAEDNFVYQGKVEPLWISQLWSGPRLEDEPEYLLLDGFLKAVDPSYTSEKVGMPPKDLGECRTLLEAIHWAHAQVMAVLFDANTWQPFIRERLSLPATECDFPVYVIDLGGGLVRSEIPAGIQGALKLEEITSAPWLSIRQGLTPFPPSEKPLPCPGEKLPLYLIIAENTLFLAKPSGTPRFIVDTALTGTQESNHFFGHWEEGEPAQLAAAPSYWEKRRVQEVRLFGRSASVIEDQLKQVAKTLNLPFCGRTMEVGGGDGKQIADSYPG